MPRQGSDFRRNIGRGDRALLSRLARYSFRIRDDRGRRDGSCIQCPFHGSATRAQGIARAMGLGDTAAKRGNCVVK